MGDDYGVMILRERLEIKELAKKKAIKWTIVINIITFIVFVAVMAFGRDLSVVEWTFLMVLIVIMITCITVLLMTLGLRAIQVEEICKRSKEYVETNLSKEDDLTD